MTPIGNLQGWRQLLASVVSAFAIFGFYRLWTSVIQWKPKVFYGTVQKDDDKRWGQEYPGLTWEDDLNAEYAQPNFLFAIFYVAASVSVPLGILHWPTFALHWHMLNSGSDMNASLVYGTWALVLVTLSLVYVTFRVTRTDLKLRVHFIFTDRFDDVRLKGHRKLLAQRLLAQSPHDEIQEDVLNLFEDLGTFYRAGYMNDELVWNTFSFYAKHWWSACKDYIAEERRRQNNDQSLFEEFQYLVDRIYSMESKKLGKTRIELEPSQADIQRFLEDEAKLV